MARSSFLVPSKLSKIVLGGTAASHTRSGVGGGHFLIKNAGANSRFSHRSEWAGNCLMKNSPEPKQKSRTAGSNHGANALPFTLPGVSGVEVTRPGDAVTAARALLSGAPRPKCPAFSVFFRFQVTDFDRLLGFFSLCHLIFPSYLFWVVSLCCVVTPKGN